MAEVSDQEKINYLYHALVKNTDNWIGTNIYPSPVYQREKSGILALPEEFLNTFDHEVYRTSNSLALAEALGIQPEFRDILDRYTKNKPQLYKLERAILGINPSDDLREFMEVLLAELIRGNVDRGRDYALNRLISVNRIGGRDYFIDGIASSLINVRLATSTMVLNIYFNEGKGPIVRSLPML